jgi:hypothetical protein
MMFWICCVAVIYAAFAYQAGSVFQPGEVAIYLFVTAMLVAGHSMANLIHMLVG